MLSKYTKEMLTFKNLDSQKLISGIKICSIYLVGGFPVFYVNFYEMLLLRKITQ